MTDHPVGLIRKQREDLAKWLNAFEYTHFITLTTHDATLTEHEMRHRLRRWDAMVNRDLYGRSWSRNRDELLWYFAFLEKPGVNPHWHILLRTIGRWGESPENDIKKLFKSAGEKWKKICPSGNVDIKEISLNPRQKLTSYLAKELGGEIQYTSFLTPDEFRR